MKIFGIGFHKTGITSLNHTLWHLGYSVVDSREDLLLSLIKEDYNSIFNISNKHVAFEIILSQFYSILLGKEYSNSKFILTIKKKVFGLSLWSITSTQIQQK
ncbi:MAG: hypothetical protein K9H26_10105 [Prolixibacteraceae bacterium]|nr:hypothetical protein [Prolixibacteraceae bacterium]